MTKQTLLTSDLKYVQVCQRLWRTSSVQTFETFELKSNSSLHIQKNDKVHKCTNYSPDTWMSREATRFGEVELKKHHLESP